MCMQRDWCGIFATDLLLEMYYIEILREKNKKEEGINCRLMLLHTGDEIIKRLIQTIVIKFLFRF